MSKVETKPSQADPSKSAEPSKLSREERFKALRSKLAASTKANHAEVIAEHKRMKLNPAHLSKLERKKVEAEMKLAKVDAEDAGDDFERKRAWDWTMEEAEAWDRRLAEKQRNRDEAAFADYTQTAEKAYRKNVKGLKPDVEAYKRAKEEALEKGQLVKMENGEVVAVDEDGRFYSDANSLGLTEHKPTKEALDRLVEETKKKEAERESKRRRKRGDDGDVSYINQRNKVFNQKLSRYYDQYTRETREAFERGSGI